jgi:hypothetical protein
LLEFRAVVRRQAGGTEKILRAHIQVFYVHFTNVRSDWKCNSILNSASAFLKSYYAALSFRCEPSRDHTVPRAAMYYDVSETT